MIVAAFAVELIEAFRVDYKVVINENTLRKTCGPSISHETNRVRVVSFNLDRRGRLTVGDGFGNEIVIEVNSWNLVAR